MKIKSSINALKNKIQCFWINPIQQKNNEARTLIEPYFDEVWYREKYQYYGTSPIDHYLNIASAISEPNPYFDSTWYAAKHPEIELFKVNRLIHFITVGEARRYSPSTRFDPVFYTKRYPDVEKSGIPPLAHFLRHGLKEFRFPTLKDEFAKIPEEERFEALFDSRWYVEHNRLGIEIRDARKHYLEEGWLYLDPNPYFDTAWYISQCPELIAENLNPLTHYIVIGEIEGLSPSTRFDPVWYSERYPDVAASGLGLLQHFVKHGKTEGRISTRPFTFSNANAAINFAGSVAASFTPLKAELILTLGGLSDALGETIFSTISSTAEGVRNLDFPQAPFIKKLNDVAVVGGTRYVIQRNGPIIHDESFFSADEKVAHEKYYGAHRKGISLRLSVGMRPGAKLKSIINVMHEYENNYFHFLTETMPRIILAEEAVIDKSVPFSITDDLHPNIRELFDRLNAHNRPVVTLERGTLYCVDSVFQASDCSVVVDAYDGGDFATKSALDVSRVRYGVEKIRRSIESRNKGSNRIFALRNGRSRVLANQSAIALQLKKLGFSVIDTSEMNLLQQIEAFSNASIVVAPTGAQVANIVWCPKGVKVFVLGSDHPSHQFYLWEIVGRVASAEVKIVIGRSINEDSSGYGVHDNYTIDQDVLADALDQIE